MNKPAIGRPRMVPELKMPKVKQLIDLNGITVVITPDEHIYKTPVRSRIKKSLTYMKTSHENNDILTRTDKSYNLSFVSEDTFDLENTSPTANVIRSEAKPLKKGKRHRKQKSTII